MATWYLPLLPASSPVLGPGGQGWLSPTMPVSACPLLPSEAALARLCHAHITCTSTLNSHHSLWGGVCWRGLRSKVAQDMGQNPEGLSTQSDFTPEGRGLWAFGNPLRLHGSLLNRFQSCTINVTQRDAIYFYFHALHLLSSGRDQGQGQTLVNEAQLSVLSHFCVKQSGLVLYR